MRTLLLAGALGAFPVSLAHAGGQGPRGEDPDLLRGTFSPFCEPAMLCHYGKAPPASSAPASAPGRPASAPVRPSAPLALVPAARPAAAAGQPVIPPPSPAAALPWRASYSVALRGSLVQSNGQSRYETLLIPHAGLSLEGQGTRAALEGSATLVQPQQGDGRIGAARLEASLAHILAPATRLSLEAALSVTQDDPADFDMRPAGVMTGPLEFRGSATAALDRQFGRFALSGSLGVVRLETGETRLADGGVIDNSADDRTSVSGRIRLGYALTPIFGVFASAESAREDFDRVSANLGASRSGWTHGLRGGITADWHDRTTLEAWLGTGWRRHDDPGLPGTQSVLYGFALGYNPSPTLRLRAALDTTIEPGRGAIIGSVDHTLSLEAAYRVNQWLGLRGTATGTWSQAQETGALTRRYGAGVGADIVLGAHSGLTLDYLYGWRDDQPGVPVPLSGHRLSAGITLRY